MKNRFRFALAIFAAAALSMTSCSKDEEKETETDTPENNGTTEVKEMETFDVEDYSFGVTETTTSSITTEWKDSFDSVKLELSKYNGSYSSVQQKSVTGQKTYTFEGLDAESNYRVTFNFYKDNKVSTNYYTAATYGSDSLICDGDFNLLDVREIAGLKLAMYDYGRTRDVYHYKTLNCYGDTLCTYSDEYYLSEKHIAYNYHPITRAEFNQILVSAGISEDVLNVSEGQIGDKWKTTVWYNDDNYDLNLKEAPNYVLFPFEDGDNLCSLYLHFGDGLYLYESCPTTINEYTINQFIFVHD